MSAAQSSRAGVAADDYRRGISAYAVSRQQRSNRNRIILSINRQ
jgi:hypothetical protein